MKGREEKENTKSTIGLTTKKRILRDYTPNHELSEKSVDDIVRTPWRHGVCIIYVDICVDKRRSKQIRIVLR